MCGCGNIVTATATRALEDSIRARLGTLEQLQDRGKMPFGIFGGGKKKAYSVQQKQDEMAVKFASSSRSSRRNSAPAGILKKSGRSRPVSFPGLVDGMVPSEMAAAVPMPNEPELNSMFAELVVSGRKID